LSPFSTYLKKIFKPAAIPPGSHPAAAYGPLYTLLLLSIAVTGVLALWLDLGASDFQPDEYHFMKLVHKSLPDYVFAFVEPAGQEIQFWLCNRVFGGSLTGYRLPAAIAGALHLALVMFVIRRFWPSRPLIAPYVGAMLAFSASVFYYGRWGIATHAEGVLIASFLILTFTHMVVTPLRKKTAILVVVPGTCLLPWIYFPLIVPLCVGLGVLVVARIFRPPAAVGKGWWKRFADLLCFLPAVVSCVLAFVSDRSVIIGYHPVSIANLYFVTSGYEQTLAGAVKYAFDSSRGVVEGLVYLDGSIPPSIRRWAFRTWLVLFAVGVLFTFVRRPIDLKRLAVLVLGVLIASADLLLCFLDKYPYGDARYAFSLLIPVLLLAGHGLSDLVELLILKPIRPVMVALFYEPGVPAAARRAKTCLLLVVLAVFLSGSVRQVSALHKMRVKMRSTNDAIISLVKEGNYDVLLADNYTLLWLDIRAPEAFKKLHTMGFSLDSRKDPPKDYLIRIVNEKNSRVQTVLVLTWGWNKPWDEVTEEDYPGFKVLFPKEEFQTVLSLSQERMHAAQLVRVQKPVARLSVTEGPLRVFQRQLGSTRLSADV